MSDPRPDRTARGFALAAVLLFMFRTPSGASFQDEGWGVRARGMGQAFSALADDASAPFWNPAGTARLKRAEAALVWERPYPQLDGVTVGSGFASLVVPTRAGSFGLAWTDFNVSGFLQENVWVFHYARRVNGRLSAGANLKYLSHDYTVGNDPAYSSNPVFAGGTGKGALTGDLGLLYELAPSVSLGFAARNITRPDVGLATEDKVPAEYQGGVAWKPNGRLLLEADDSYRSQDYGTFGDKDRFSLGAEYWLSEGGPLGLRAGYNPKEFALGFSLRPRSAGNLGFRLDYAFILGLADSEDHPSAHQVGISLLFGAGPAAPESAPPAPVERRPPAFRTRPAERPRPAPVRKPSVAVLHFSAKGVSLSDADAVRWEVRRTLAGSGAVSLIRPAAVEKAIQDEILAESRSSRGSRAERIGRRLQAQQVVEGSLSRTRGRYIVRVFFVDAATGRVLAREAVSVTSRGRLRAAAAEAARKGLSRILPNALERNQR